MKKLLLSTALVLGMVAPVYATDFSSSFTTGTKTVQTTGEVKITGTSKEWSNVELKGIEQDYAISVYPCSGCASNVDQVNDYTVKGDYKSWETTKTNLNITQNIDSQGSGTICEVTTDLSGFKTGNSSERMNYTSVTTTHNLSTSVVEGGDKFTGNIYDGHTVIGTVSDGSVYHQNVATDVKTTVTEHKTTYNVKSYFGN